jgi:hypothetical protein
MKRETKDQWQSQKKFQEDQAKYIKTNLNAKNNIYIYILNIKYVCNMI